MIIDKKLEMGQVTTTTTAMVKTAYTLDLGANQKNFLGNALTTDTMPDVYLIVQLAAVTAQAGTITITLYTDDTDGLTTVGFIHTTSTMSAQNPIPAGSYIYNGPVPLPLKRYVGYGITCSDATADVTVNAWLSNGPGTSS